MRDALDPILAIDLDPTGSNRSYPPAEAPANVLDGNPNTKYVNFGGAGAGLIVTPQFGVFTVRSMQLTTANDRVERGPTSFELYGTNDPITSTDNSRGMNEKWTLIDSNSIELPDEEVRCGLSEQ